MIASTPSTCIGLLVSVLWVTVVPATAIVIGEDVVVVAGNVATLSCHISAAQTVDRLTWWRGHDGNGTGIVIIMANDTGQYSYGDYARHDVIGTGSLRINGSVIGDADTYWCRVETGGMVDEDSLTLKVLTIPNNATQFHLSNRTASELTVEWKPGYNGGARQVFSIHYQTLDKFNDVSGEWMRTRTWTENSCTIFELSPMTYYVITVISSNVAGNTTSDPIIHSTLPPTPTLQDIYFNTTEGDLLIRPPDDTCVEIQLYIGSINSTLYDGGDDYNPCASEVTLYLQGLFRRFIYLDIYYCLENGPIRECGESLSLFWPIDNPRTDIFNMSLFVMILVTLISFSIVVCVYVYVGRAVCKRHADGNIPDCNRPPSTSSGVRKCQERRRRQQNKGSSHNVFMMTDFNVYKEQITNK